MKRKALAIGAAVAAIGLGGVLVACGGDDGDSGTAKAATSAQVASVDTAPAKLRADLTALLQEHVYLAGTAIGQGVGQGLDSGEFKAASQTLDRNSVALSQAIGSVYGDAAGKQFLALWRDHIGFFVDYTKAKAGKDERGAMAARQGLDDYRAQFGAFLASANPNLTKEAVAEELKPHVDSVFTTIDAVVAGSPRTFDLLRAAAGHMPGTAEVLSGAIVKQFPEKFSS